MGGRPRLSRLDTGMSHMHSTQPGAVLETDLGQNQSAEQDKYPGAAHLASGMGFSGTSDNVYAVLSSKEWAHNGKKIRYPECVHNIPCVMAEVGTNAGITHMRQV